MNLLAHAELGVRAAVNVSLKNSFWFLDACFVWIFWSSTDLPVHSRRCLLWYAYSTWLLHLHSYMQSRKAKAQDRLNEALSVLSSMYGLKLPHMDEVRFTTLSYSQVNTLLRCCILHVEFSLSNALTSKLRQVIAVPDPFLLSGIRYREKFRHSLWMRNIFATLRDSHNVI